MTTLPQTARRTPTTFKRVTIAAVLMGGLLLTACGGGGTDVVTPPAISAVTVTPAGTTLAVGATQQLKADVMGSGAYSTAVTWKSSDAAVLTVNADGLVTAKAAGTATVTATSSTDATKTGSVTITVKAATPAFATVKVSFRPQNAKTPLPTGFSADIGAAYTAAKGGWVTEATAGTVTATPLDLTLNTRDREVGSVTPEQNTFIHMQYTATGIGTKTNGAWEYNVPNGSYNVTVSVGDASAVFPDTTPPNSTHAINVEGKAALVPPFVPTAAQLFKTATVTVPVTDGKLTVDAKTGTNTKLDYVIIEAAK